MSNTSLAAACVICQEQLPACPSVYPTSRRTRPPRPLHADDRVTIGDRSYSKDEVQGALGGHLKTLPGKVMQTRRFPLGTYRGLRFGMVLNPQWAPEIYLEGATTRQDTLSRDHHGPRAILNALDRLANSYGSECTHIQQHLAIAESQLRDYEERLGKPFPHEGYLSQLTELRDRLKARLSGATPEPGSETGHSVSPELAEKIKALKAAHSIEATPQRVRQKQSTAEEPVTARIWRRTEANPVSGQAVDIDRELQGGRIFPAREGENSPSERAISFRERIAIERQTQDQAPSLP
jgi:hypothetical protein